MFGIVAGKSDGSQEVRCIFLEDDGALIFAFSNFVLTSFPFSLFVMFLFLFFSLIFRSGSSGLVLVS
jgi:hypothetical protein